VSHENVQLTRAAVESFNARDWDGLLALADEEIAIESRLVRMEGGYRGHAGMRRWWEDLLDAIPDYTVHPKEVRDHGDVTLLRFRGEGHGAASKTPVIDDAWQVTRWRDHKIVWWRNCHSEAEAIDSMGGRAT
jgi:hypothetical protein